MHLARAQKSLQSAIIHAEEHKQCRLISNCGHPPGPQYAFMQPLWRGLCLCLFVKSLVLCAFPRSISFGYDCSSPEESVRPVFAGDDSLFFDNGTLDMTALPLDENDTWDFDNVLESFILNQPTDSHMTHEAGYEDPQPETTSTKRPRASTMTDQSTKNPRKGLKFSTDCLTLTTTAPYPRVLPPRQDPSAPLSMLKAHIFLKIRRQFSAKTKRPQEDFIFHRWDHFPPSVSIYPDGWMEQDLRLIEDSIDDLEFVHMTSRQLRVHRERCSCISDPQSHMNGVSLVEQREDAGYKSPFLASLSTAHASNVEMPVSVPVFPSLLREERKKILARLAFMLRQQHGDSKYRLRHFRWENWPHHIPTQADLWDYADMAEIWRIIYTVMFVRLAKDEPMTRTRWADLQLEGIQAMMLQRYRREAETPDAEKINWKLADTTNVPSEHCILKFAHKMMTNPAIRNNHAIMDNIHFVPEHVKNVEELDLQKRLLKLYQRNMQTRAFNIPWKQVRLVGCPDGVNFSDLHLSEIRFLAKNFDSLHFIPAVA